MAFRRFTLIRWGQSSTVLEARSEGHLKNLLYLFTPWQLSDCKYAASMLWRDRVTWSSGNELMVLPGVFRLEDLRRPC